MHFAVTSTKYKLPDGMKEVQGPKLGVSSYFRGSLKAINVKENGILHHLVLLS